MLKENALDQLRNAKKAHISWVQRANTLIEGFPVHERQIPVKSTDCAFGSWFYGEGQRLNTIPGMDILEEIELHHTELHAMYLKIFDLYFKDTDRSFISKLFGIKKKISLEAQKEAKEYFNELKVISEALLLDIDRLERRIVALSESYFTKKQFSNEGENLSL